MTLILPLPDAGFTMDDATLCMNQQTGLLNTNSSDGTLDWNLDFGAGADVNPGVGPGPHSITYNSAGVKTIFLSLTDLTTGCVSQNSVAVTVMVAAKFAVQDTESVCDAIPYTTNFDASNFNSINWAPSSGLTTCTIRLIIFPLELISIN